MRPLRALTVVLGFAIGCQPARPSAPAASPTATATAAAPRKAGPPNGRTIRTGSPVVIVAESGEMMLSADADTFAESSRMVARRDAAGLARLEREGKVFIVPTGTAGTLLETGILRVRVRIEGGPFAGREGWIEPEFVGPAPAAGKR